MSEATWPIRIGGEYYSTDMEHTFARVTEIDAEQVYWDLFRDDCTTTNGFCSKHHISSSIFRRMYAPEDQSPIPTLVEALKSALNLVEEVVAQANCCMIHVGVSERGQEWVRNEMRVYGAHLVKPIEAALTKAHLGETEGTR